MSRKPTQNNHIHNLVIDRQVIFYAIILLGVYWLFNLYKPILSSLVIGVLLAYLLHPLVVILTEKLHFRHRLAAGIVFISFLIFILFAIRFSTPIMITQVNVLAKDFDLISAELISLQPALDNLVDLDIPLAEIIPEIMSELEQFLVPAKLFRIILSATSNLIWVMIILMTCFYLLMDHSKFMNWLNRITPLSLRDPMIQIQKEIDLVWRTFLRGQFSLMLLIGVLSGLGGYAVGLKNALVIGVIAGILELIPSLGPTITTIIAAISAWTQGSQTLDISNTWFVIIVCSIFITIQFLENTIIVPRIMSKRMKIHPALVFIAIISTLTLFGVLAGLIVIPLIGSFLVIIKYMFHYWDIDSSKGTIPAAE